MTYGPAETSQRVNCVSTPSEKIRQLIESCHKHAEDLQRAAKVLHEQEKLHHLAFHLSVLALEEIGKAGLLLSAYHVGQFRDAPEWVQKHTEDHVRKLFWAFWGPQTERELITTEYLQNIDNAARATHELRLRALYVDMTTDGVSVPSGTIDEGASASILQLLGASLALARNYSLSGGSAEDRELFGWFLQASEDETKSNEIFGRKSLEKRAELGDVWKWIAWLKEQYDEAERIADEMRDRELRRRAPTGDEWAEPKWGLTIRLHTTTHTIRPKALGAANKRSELIKHAAVNHHKDQLLVEFTIPRVVLFERLWDVSFASARRYVAALNIASLGHFWWHLPEQATRFYDRLKDLETGAEVVMEKRTHAVEPVPRRRPLEERELLNALLFYSVMPDADDEAGSKLYADYLGGLTFLGKHDVHLQIEPVAYQHFFRALRSGMAYYLGPDGVDLETTFDREFSDFVTEESERREYVRLGQLALDGKLETGMVRLEQVLNLKVLCDAFLNRVLRLKVKARLEAEKGTETD